MNKLHPLIDELSPDDALDILQTLAHNDEALASQVVEIVRERLTHIDPEDIANSFCADLDGLDVEEVWARSGKTRHGYVETNEAACEMMDEVFQPYLSKLKKCQQLGLTTQANELCMGLVLGLYIFEAESTSKFKDWATDLPGSFADEVINEWKKGNPDPKDVAEVKEFLEDEGIGWQLRIA